MIKAFTIVELVVVLAVIAVLSAVLIPTFSNIIRSANESDDIQLIRNLNTLLVTDSTINGLNHQSFSEALEAIELGPEHLKMKSDRDVLLWDQDNDLFCCLRDNKLVYVSDIQGQLSYHTEDPDSDVPENQNYKLWIIGDDEDVAKGIFSVYYIGSSDEVTVTTGFDAGKSNVRTVHYERDSVNPRNVIIQTVNGTLSVNSPSDTVEHYGKSEETLVTAVSDNSYVEHGTSVFLKVQSGRIVVTCEAEIGGIHVLSTDYNGNKFYNKVILKAENDAALPAITRADAAIDTITSTSAVGTYSQYFLEIQHSDEAIENIWLEAKVENGTLQKQVLVSETIDSGEKSLVMGSITPMESSNLNADIIEGSTSTYVVEAVAKSNAIEKYQSRDDFVAKIGNICYTTVKEAVSVARTATVEIIKDCDAEFISSNPITINGGDHTLTVKQDCSAGTIILAGDLTIDMNQYTVTGVDDIGFIVGSGNKLTIKGTGGKWTASCGISLSGGTVDISGGGISGTEYGISGYGSINVTGGLVESTEGTAVFVTGTSKTTTVAISAGEITGVAGGIAIDINSTGNVTVSGTAVVSATGIDSTCRAINYSYNKYSKGTLTVSGGTFRTSPDSGAYTIYYYTNSGSLKLTGGSYNGSSGIYYNRAMDVTISNVTVNAESTKPNYGINNAGSKTLTISNSSINVTGSSTVNGIYNTAKGTIALSGGTLYVEGSGTNTYGIYNKAAGTINVSGGTIALSGGTNTYGIYNKAAGTVNVSGGTITSLGKGKTYGIYNGSTGPVTATNVTMTAESTGKSKYSYIFYNNSTGSISISGGNYTVKAKSSSYKKITNKADGITITGGTFNLDPSEYIDQDVYAVTGSYTVTVK